VSFGYILFQAVLVSLQPVWRDRFGNDPHDDENGQAITPLRSFQVTDFGTSRKPVCDSNVNRNLHRFQDIADIGLIFAINKLENPGLTHKFRLRNLGRRIYTSAYRMVTMVQPYFDIFNRFGVKTTRAKCYELGWSVDQPINHNIGPYRINYHVCERQARRDGLISWQCATLYECGGKCRCKWWAIAGKAEPRRSAKEFATEQKTFASCAAASHTQHRQQCILLDLIFQTKKFHIQQSICLHSACHHGDKTNCNLAVDVIQAWGRAKTRHIRG